MTLEVTRKIDQIRHGVVPEGYKKTKAGTVPAEWTEYTIADCLKRVERPVEVKSDEMYTQIGIRSHGKGLFYKEPVNGKALGNKSVFWIEPDCFVLNIVFAWEQAIGKTTQKEGGMIGSHRFPMYRPINERVDIDYLIFYLMTKRGKDILETASPGGAGRNRTLGQDRFMNSKIVLPTLTEQKKIASILTMQDKIIELEQQKIEEIKKAKRFFLEKMFPKEGQPVPEIRFKGFTAPWEQRKLGDLLQTHPFKQFLKEPEPDGKYEIIQQGNEPVIGFANGTPCGDYKDVVIFGDHTLSLYKPQHPFFVATDGVRIVKGQQDTDGYYLLSLLERYKPQSEGYKRYYCILADTNCITTYNTSEQGQIGAFFKHLDHLITLHQRELAEVEKYKKALMQLLLTGLVRVNA